MNKKLMMDDQKHGGFNKKSIMVIVVLVVIGIIIGMLTSTYFLNDANWEIKKWNKNIEEWGDKWQNFSWNNHTWDNSNYSNGNDSDWYKTGNFSSSNHNNSSWMGFYQPLTPLNYHDVILPSITTILLCISSLILLALIATYIKIFKDTKSKYILGLLLVLTPLLIVSVFFIRIAKSLFFSSALEYSFINYYFGFGINGIGGMMSILSIFMILGFTLLFYLSNE